MSLVNFRCDTTLKEEAFAILKDLKKQPSDLFKDVLTYVVKNKRLPIENILMSVNDLEQSAQDSKSQYLSGLVNSTKPQNTLSIQSCLNLQKQDAFQIAVAAIQNINTSLIIAENSICTSIPQIDQLIELSDTHQRELLILDISTIEHGVYDSSMCYNPLRGKCTGATLMIALSPFYEITVAENYCNHLLNVYLNETSAFNDMTFEVLHQVTATLSQKKYSLFKTEPEIEAFNALETALNIILQSPLAKVLAPNADCVYFDLADIIKNKKVGLIEDSPDRLRTPLSEAQNFFYAIFNADFRTTLVSLKSQELEHLTHILVSPHYLSLQNSCSAMRSVRKLNISFYTFTEYFDVLPETSDQFQRLAQTSHNILLSKPVLNANISIISDWVDSDTFSKLQKLKGSETLLVRPHSGVKIFK